MVADKKREIGVFGITFWIFIAMTIYGNNAIGVLTYDYTTWIHTKRTYFILIFFTSVNDLTFIKLICQIREDTIRKLYTNTDIHAITFRANMQRITNSFHPLTAATTSRDNAIGSGKAMFTAPYTITIFYFFYLIDMGIKMNVDLIF